MEKTKSQSLKVTTPEFRVAFPNVFEAKAINEGQTPFFSVTMLFDKNADLALLKKAAHAAIKKKWPTNPPSNLRNPFRPGSEKAEKYEGYEGTIYINAKTKMKPGVVDGARNKIVDQSEFYAGCYARATIVPYAYNKAGNAGVAFALHNIQKIKEGESLGGRAKAEDDFEALEGMEVEGFGDTFENDNSDTNFTADVPF